MALGAAGLSSGAEVSGLLVLVLLMCMAGGVVADCLGLVQLNLLLALKLAPGIVVAWTFLRELLGPLLLL
jgi:hypothetical protein